MAGPRNIFIGLSIISVIGFLAACQKDSSSAPAATPSGRAILVRTGAYQDLRAFGSEAGSLVRCFTQGRNSFIEISRTAAGRNEKDEQLNIAFIGTQFALGGPSATSTSLRISAQGSSQIPINYTQSGHEFFPEQAPNDRQGGCSLYVEKSGDRLSGALSCEKMNNRELGTFIGLTANWWDCPVEAR